MDDRKVRDLAQSLDEYATISCNCTIREALIALSEAQLGLSPGRHQHRAVLVLDGWGNVVGKLTHWAILRSLEPDLLRSEDLASLDRAGLSAEFVSRLKQQTRMFSGSMTRMCEAAGRVRVEDAMVPVGESISENAPLSEAIQLLVLLHSQSLLVRRDDTVVGILRISDVFEEVANQIRGKGV
jgi:CBS domain-containing protein